MHLCFRLGIGYDKIEQHSPQPREDLQSSIINIQTCIRKNKTRFDKPT
mgnify:FL=1